MDHFTPITSKTPHVAEKIILYLDWNSFMKIKQISSVFYHFIMESSILSKKLIKGFYIRHFMQSNATWMQLLQKFKREEYPSLYQVISDYKWTGEFIPCMVLKEQHTFGLIYSDLERLQYFWTKGINHPPNALYFMVSLKLYQSVEYFLTHVEDPKPYLKNNGGCLTLAAEKGLYSMVLLLLPYYSSDDFFEEKYFAATKAWNGGYQETANLIKSSFP